MNNKNLDIVFRAVRENEIDVLINLIKEFSVYVDGKDTTDIDKESMREALHHNDKAKSLFIEAGSEIIGYIVYFNMFSTFKGKLFIYLEDVYIKEKFRGMGIGSKVFEYLKAVASESGCSKIEWNCLKSNESAMNFYENNLCASNMDDLRFFTLENF